MKNILGSLPARLLLGVIAGILVGLYANEALMQVILTLKNLLGSLIIFCVPLIIIGFIAPSITRLGQHASTMLRVAITLAYVSSIGAAFFAMLSGYGIIPHLNIVSSVDGLKELPKLLFDLKIDPIMSVMSALVFSVLFGVAGIYAGANPMEVLKHYWPAYITAVGTMSSAATLAVALECARKSKVLRKDLVNFGIPLFANIHLCGSVLTEVFFVMTVSQILYGALPELGTMILFCLLLGIFAIGAPGVPGGTVMASLGLIISVLGFDATGTALMLTIFALQDSFGTACNVTGDGALTLALTGYAEKNDIEEVNEASIL